MKLTGRSCEWLGRAGGLVQSVHDAGRTPVSQALPAVPLPFVVDLRFLYSCNFAGLRENR